MSDHRPQLKLPFLAATAAADLGAADSENRAPGVKNTNLRASSSFWWNHVLVYVDNTSRINKVGPLLVHELVDALGGPGDPSEPPVSGIGRGFVAPRHPFSRRRARPKSKSKI